MGKLVLDILMTPEPQLARTIFAHELLAEELICERRSGVRAKNDYSSFSWSNALRAFTIFCVRAASIQSENIDQNGTGDLLVLQGEAGSAAASLDNAILKDTNWLLNICGIDFDGRSLARQFITRVNSGLRNSGPVRLFLNQSVLPRSAIEVIIDGQRILSPGLLAAIATALEGNWSQSSTARLTSAAVIKPRVHVVDERRGTKQESEPTPSFFVSEQWKAHLIRLYKDETLNMLCGSGMFSRRDYFSLGQELRANPSFTRLTKDFRRLEGVLQWNAPVADRIGIVDKNELARLRDFERPPLRIAITPAQTATFAILSYLSDRLRLNIEIVFQYSIGPDIVRAIRDRSFEGNADACVVTIASAARLIGYGDKLSYKPLLSMPRLSHRVLTSQHPHTRVLASYDDLPPNGKYLFVTDEPSTSSFYWDELIRQGLISRSGNSIGFAAPADITSAMAVGDPDLRTILGFPHYCFSQMLCSSVSPERLNIRACNQPAMMFVSANLFADTKTCTALCAAIRHAWIALSESSADLDGTVRQMLAAPRYLSILCRTCGLNSQALT